MKSSKKIKSKVVAISLYFLVNSSFNSCTKYEFCLSDLSETNLKVNQIYELVSDNYCDNGVDDFKVFPIQKSNMKIDEGTFLIRSENYFADGRVVPGYYIFSGRDLSVNYYHPYLFGKSHESLLLYTGMVDPKASANSIFVNYGNLKDIFPVKSVTPFFEFNLPGIFFLTQNKKLMYLNIR